jgi:uncharacterized delta-60 repeat protein
MKFRFILITMFLFSIFTSGLFAQGATMRVLTYNGPGNGVDEVTGITIDPSGNIYVTGYSKGSNTDEDFATMKFNNNGDFLWVNRFDGTGHYTDRAVAIAADMYGNVYVTGWAHMEPQDNNDEILCGTIDYVTIKYNTYGVQQWINVYNGTGGGDDVPSGMVLDRSGNVYVTGKSMSSSNHEDYLTIKYQNDGTREWIARYDGASHNEDLANALAVDLNGNVFVTGSSYKSGSAKDYVTVKYNIHGQQQWAKNYNGPANSDDIAYAITTDINGACFVTGTSRGSGSNFDYATLKYNPDGTQGWLQRYNGPGNNIDEAHAIIQDPYGYTYVTGFSMGSGTSYDYATLRYDPNGNQLWLARYNGQANLIDKAWDIGLIKRICGNSGDYPCWKFEVYVTGQSQGSGTGYDFLTIRYDENGNDIWHNQYASSGNVEDVATKLTLRDNFGYVFAAGRINNDYGIVQISNRSWTPVNNFSLKGDNGIPNEFSLAQNYPNPFNPSTVISYGLSNDAYVVITVYNLLGKKISSLVNEFQPAGSYNVTFNAANLPSGTYIYTIKAGSYVSSKKMVLMK